MRRRRFGSHRSMRVGLLSLLLFLTALLLVSCVAGSNVLWVRGILGLDIGDYEAEAVTEYHELNSALAKTLSDTVGVVLGASVHLTPFGGTEDAVNTYRDAILNHMLRTNYAQYTKHGEQMKKAEKSYPRMMLTTLISESEFENTVFRYFGGTTVEHEGGRMFSHLDRADAYTTPAPAIAACVAVSVLSLEETQNTYRMCFTLSDGTQTSNPYMALFVKRSDGTAYWKALRIAA